MGDMGKKLLIQVPGKFKMKKKKNTHKMTGTVIFKIKFKYKQMLYRVATLHVQYISLIAGRN
jgi:hypothetical protein